jgi:hypothetical protein
MWDPGRAEWNVVEPVDVGDSPDKAHDDQTLGSDVMDGALCGDGLEVGEGSDVQDGPREGKVCDDLVAAVEADDDDETVVVVVVLAVVPAAAVAVVVAAYAWRVPLKGNLEGGQLRSFGEGRTEGGVKGKGQG